MCFLCFFLCFFGLVTKPSEEGWSMRCTTLSSLVGFEEHDAVVADATGAAGLKNSMSKVNNWIAPT